jgi:hypothetical protein
MFSQIIPDGAFVRQFSGIKHTKRAITCSKV